MTITRFSSGGPYEDVIGYSRVVRAGELFLTAGCTSVRDGEVVHVGDPYQQTITAFWVGLEALLEAGCPAENVIATRMYVTERAHVGDVGRAHSAVFDAIRPTASMILVSGFVDERMLVEVELTGYLR